MAEFALSTQSFTAERQPKPFTCKVDGMHLKGLGLDWMVTREDGQSFPLPDHIFKMIFVPVDEPARKLFYAKYNLAVGIAEGITVKDHVDRLVGKLRGRSNTP